MHECDANCNKTALTLKILVKFHICHTNDVINSYGYGTDQRCADCERVRLRTGKADWHPQNILDPRTAEKFRTWTDADPNPW